MTRCEPVLVVPLCPNSRPRSWRWPASGPVSGSDSGWPGGVLVGRVSRLAGVGLDWALAVAAVAPASRLLERAPRLSCWPPPPRAGLAGATGAAGGRSVGLLAASRASCPGWPGFLRIDWSRGGGGGSKLALGSRPAACSSLARSSSRAALSRFWAVSESASCAASIGPVGRAPRLWWRRQARSAR